MNVNSVSTPVPGGNGRYTTVAVLLHWAIAALLVLQLSLGWRIDDASGGDRRAVLQLHKTIGIGVLVLMLLRLGWRLLKPPPTAQGGSVEQKLAKWVHRAFYLALFGLPLSGWALVSFGSSAVKLLGGLQWPRLPLRSMIPPGAMEATSMALGNLHLALVWGILALLALHVAGALRHHFSERAGVMLRMVTWARPGRVWEGRLLAIPVVALVLMTAAFLVRGTAADAAAARPMPTTPDDAIVYQDVIAPMLSRRCGACHDDDWSRGGLSLASFDSTMSGGVHGASIRIGDPKGSELLRRVSLPATDRLFMPRDGKTALNADQLKILHWWIEKGARPDARASTLQPDAEVQAALGRVLGLSGESTAGVGDALPTVAAGDVTAIAALENNGFVVRPVANGSNLLDVSRFAQRPISEQDVTSLAQLSQQIRTLSLPDASLTDAQLGRLVAAPHLVSLRISGNPVTDRGLPALASAPELGSLNVYGTKVTDAGLGVVASLPKLKRLYVWETAVTKAGAERLRESRPDVVLDLDSQDAVARK